jgi:membrane protease YdiL (CAAX protease family)
MKSLKAILFTLLAIAVVVLIPQSGIINKIIPLPFSYSIVILVFIWLFLKLSKENFSSLGFSFKRFNTKAVLIGTIAGIILFAFLQYAFFPLLKQIIPLSPADLGFFNKVRHNTGTYVFTLAMGWLVGGIYEEIAFHGFIFTRLEKLFTGKYAVPISFLLTNIIFACYHWQLGTSGVINAFIAGMVYHALILRYKRNMWYGIICHAVFDTIALTFIYLGYW